MRSYDSPPQEDTDELLPVVFVTEVAAIIDELRFMLARRARRAANYYDESVKAVLARTADRSKRIVPKYMPRVFVSKKTYRTEIGWVKRTKLRNDRTVVRYCWTRVTGKKGNDLLEYLFANVDPCFHDAIHHTERAFEDCRRAQAIIRSLVFALNGKRHLAREADVAASPWTITRRLQHQTGFSDHVPVLFDSATD